MTPRDDRAENLVNDDVERQIDRRRFLQRATALGISLGGVNALLAACGGEEAAAPPPPPEPGGDTTGATTEAASVATTEAGTTAEAAPAGGTLTLRMEGDMMNPDPAVWAGFADDPIMRCVYEGLVSYKPGTWELVNTLAQEFEPSADGLRFAFTLKEGIPFHGGYGEVTAEDVKFSFERIAGLTKPKLESPFAGDWPTLQEVKVTGTYTGEIVLKAPFAPLLTTTLPLFSGAVLSKQAVEERGEDYATHPIGTGPYEFGEWTPKQQIVLTRFADYGGASSEYAAPVQWDEIVMTVIPEASAADIAIETGEVDFGSIPNTSVERFEEEGALTVHNRTTLDFQWLAMNVQHPKLEDVNVRQAIRYAIDVPALLEVAYSGRATRANAILPEGMSIGYWPDAPQYERDVEQARSFLEQAGVDSLDLKLIVRSGTAFGTSYKDAGEIVQANLAEIGINVEIVTLDDASYVEAPMGDKGVKEVELMYSTFTTSPDPSWSTVWFTCEQIGVWNWMFWCNEEYDRLNVEAISELDPATRTEMYIQIQQLMDEAVHSVWIAYPTLYFAGKPELTPSLQPDGRVIAWDFRSA